jgi:hypothetical protein
MMLFLFFTKDLKSQVMNMQFGIHYLNPFNASQNDYACYGYNAGIGIGNFGLSIISVDNLETSGIANLMLSYKFNLAKNLGRFKPFLGASIGAFNPNSMRVDNFSDFFFGPFIDFQFYTRNDVSLFGTYSVDCFKLNNEATFFQRFTVGFRADLFSKKEFLRGWFPSNK